RAVGVPHEHGLDLGTVGGAPQPLRGHAVITVLFGIDRERERERIAESGAQVFRQIRERVEGPALFIQPFVQLPRPVRRLTQLLHDLCEVVARRAVTGGHTSTSYARSTR